MDTTPQPGLLICPTCGQRMPGSQRRVCGLCQKPILRHEKYCYEGSMVRHRDCADPRGERAWERNREVTA